MEQQVCNGYLLLSLAHPTFRRWYLPGWSFFNERNLHGTGRKKEPIPFFHSLEMVAIRLESRLGLPKGLWQTFESSSLPGTDRRLVGLSQALENHDGFPGGSGNHLLSVLDKDLDTCSHI
jgi:hypothetical protein